MLQRKLMRGIGTLIAVIAFSFIFSKTYCFADTAGEYLLDENVGASIVFNTGAYNDAETDNLGIEVPEVVLDEIEVESLIMVEATSVLNVRSEGNSEAEIVGKMYKDCGGILLERGEEWSLIESGDLVGWCSNKYLRFDEEAIEIAKEVGSMLATVNVSCAKVYSDSSKNADVLGYAAYNSLFEVIYEVDEDWICVAFDEYDGYIRTEYVDIDFIIDHGETMEAISERKKREAEEKKKMIRRNEAIEADGDTLKVLATIIWCESRGESYEGQLAVGSVVMNRVRSGSYPDTVYDVVFASGQFSPVKTGSFQKAYERGSAVNTPSWKAAEETLGGYTNVGDMTHFRRKGNKEGYIIGNHVFY